MFQWQMYWPSWWKCWPSYNSLSDPFGPTIHTFCFGAFQCRWYGNKRF